MPRHFEMCVQSHLCSFWHNLICGCQGSVQTRCQELGLLHSLCEKLLSNTTYMYIFLWVFFFVKLTEMYNCIHPGIQLYYMTTENDIEKSDAGMKQ